MAKDLSLRTAAICALLAIPLVYHATSFGDEGQLSLWQQKIMTRVWWNQPKRIESLSLSEEQRARMDEFLTTYLRQSDDNAAQRKVGMEALGTAIAEGDEKSARNHRDEMESLTAGAVRLQIDMMIAAAAEMTPEQRRLLYSQSPNLFSRFWVRSPKPGRARISQDDKKSPPPRVDGDKPKPEL